MGAAAGVDGPARAGVAVPGVDGPARGGAAVPGVDGPARGGAAVPGGPSRAMGAGVDGPARGGASVPGRGPDGLPGPDDSQGLGANTTGSVRQPGSGDASRGNANGVPLKDETAEGGLAELRHKLRTQRRLRLVTLFSLAALVLLALPAFVGLRAASSDPVLASLAALKVPSWAAKGVENQETGSTLCIMECSFRERKAESDRPFKETADVYTEALTKAGWKQRTVEGCPETPVAPEEGTYSCWSRDEFTLDLAVGLPGCAVDQISAEQNPTAGAAEELPDPAACQGSTVRIKVWNKIEDRRGEKETTPGLVGVTPDTVLSTDDPLLSPTPQAS
ncbi:hypothetical protein [Actinoplanes campanulatus]|nr:hypothetical protein [Actinoplanes capillaceus]